MKQLYRYEIIYREDGYASVAIQLKEIKIERETEKTYFIRTCYSHKEKRVSKNALNTYAYDNKKDAMDHFERRTRTRVRWFEYWMENCNVALELIKKMESEDKYICDEDNKILDSIDNKK